MCSQVSELRKLRREYWAMVFNPIKDAIWGTALHVATLRRNSYAVEKLLKAGAEVNEFCTAANCTALYNAISGSRFYKPEIVELLINFGVNINHPIKVSNDGRQLTAMQVAIHDKNSEVVKSLLSFGASINRVNQNSQITPLELAIQVGAIKTVKVIKEHIVKFYEADLYVCDSNIAAVREDGQFDELRSQCYYEVECMRRMGISEDVNSTYYDILFNSVDETESDLLKLNISNVPSVIESFRMFREYCDILTCKFNKLTNRTRRFKYDH
ncbi:uncharacterized protein LOC106693150 [Microplitis demolitor]|uniref:uncharacterized protein LOC106693150 n=1 Tax=Microplitis demolitor TaxID=69319 RepID=UPI0006D4F089|nr:uncharacterized protein LOC106693150 [Microplitis demolitor]